MNLSVRTAERRDCRLILDFIKSLAEYEERSHEVEATVELLEEWLFEKQAAEVVFAVVDGVEAGFALYVRNFSTFLGRAGIHLEDIFVLPDYRGLGIGKTILNHFLDKLDPSSIAQVFLDLPIEGEGFSRALIREGFTPRITRYCLALSSRKHL